MLLKLVRHIKPAPEMAAVLRVFAHAARLAGETDGGFVPVKSLVGAMRRRQLAVIAATNFAARLDPATTRRFVFKLQLRPLTGDKAARAFQKFYGCEAPAALRGIHSLTPGNFAVVARQLRHDPARGADDIVARLAAEVAAKPCGEQADWILGCIQKGRISGDLEGLTVSQTLPEAWTV